MADMVQGNWGWCRKCLGLCWAEFLGVCPARSVHEFGASLDYDLASSLRSPSSSGGAGDRHGSAPRLQVADVDGGAPPSGAALSATDSAPFAAQPRPGF